MNFPLKNIELHLEETALLIGEKLFEKGKVEGLHETERNLWLAEVERNEVEVQISPGKVKAITCECNVFKTNKICGHIAATLFALRKLLTTQKEKRKSSYFLLFL